MAKGVRNVIEVFKAIPTRKRISILIILVIVAVGFVAFFTNPNRSNYTVLFTDLDSVEALKITEKLKEKKVKYLLKDSGVLKKYIVQS